MAVLKAAALILLAIVPLINAYPIAQTAENKGRGRSYPLIISHYSNVRNSKYSSPSTTEAATEVESSDDVQINDDNDTKTINPKIDEKANPVEDKDQDDVVVEEIKNEEKLEDKVDEKIIEPVNIEETKSDVSTLEDEKKKADIQLEEVNIEETKTADVSQQDKKIEEEKKTEQVVKTEFNESDAPNMASDSAISTKNESVLAAVEDTEESLVSKTAAAAASPSNENVEKIESSTKVESAEPVTESSTAVASLVDASTVVPVVNNQEASSSTSLAVEEIKTEVNAVAAGQPAALEDGDKPQMETKASNTPASNADSVAKQEEAISKVEEEEVSSPVEGPPSQDENAQSTKTVVEESAVQATEIKSSPVAESTDTESSRSAVLESEKKKPTSEFFEEDRSFKDRPEDLILAAIRQTALDEQKNLAEKLANKNLDALNVDDIANEGIRLERDDKKTDKKEKEKEKYPVKPSLKEKKPSKPIVSSSDDPVQEYDELSRSGRAKDETASNTESTPSDKAADEEPVVISLVPSNYPVILPNGQSTLSDKIQPAETAKGAEEEAAPVVIGLVPNNAPVILPNGEAALSEVKPAEAESQSGDQAAAQ